MLNFWILNFESLKFSNPQNLIIAKIYSTWQRSTTHVINANLIIIFCLFFTKIRWCHSHLHFQNGAKKQKIFIFFLHTRQSNLTDEKSVQLSLTVEDSSFQALTWLHRKAHVPTDDLISRKIQLWHSRQLIKVARPLETCHSSEENQHTTKMVIY